MAIKIFKGQAPDVERWMNEWSDDGTNRNVQLIVMPTGDSDVAVMAVYQDNPLPPPVPGRPKLVVPTPMPGNPPNGGMVH